MMGSWYRGGHPPQKRPTDNRNVAPSHHWNCFHLLLISGNSRAPRNESQVSRFADIAWVDARVGTLPQRLTRVREHNVFVFHRRFVRLGCDETRRPLRIKSASAIESTSKAGHASRAQPTYTRSRERSATGGTAADCPDRARGPQMRRPAPTKEMSHRKIRSLQPFPSAGP
jgi:hypothetical protein